MKQEISICWMRRDLRITDHAALIGGYRWLQVDYDDDQGFVFDTRMKGFMVGAKFSW